MKKEDTYIAVEKNAAGSRPKELFEDVLEEVEAAYESCRSTLRVRTVLGSYSGQTLEILSQTS